MQGDGTREEALAIRRKVLGSEYVDGGIARATAFDRPMQEFAIEHCWGTVWTRPGLSYQTRSLLNVAMLAALGHERELRLHVVGALRNGCTQEDVQEVLLQVGVYCGVPAAVSAFAIARDAIAEYLAANPDSDSQSASGTAPRSSTPNGTVDVETVAQAGTTSAVAQPPAN